MENLLDSSTSNVSLVESKATVDDINTVTPPVDNATLPVDNAMPPHIDNVSAPPQDDAMPLHVDAITPPPQDDDAATPLDDEDTPKLEMEKVEHFATETEEQDITIVEAENIELSNVDEDLMQIVSPEQDVEESLVMLSLGRRTLTRDNVAPPSAVTPPTEVRGRSHAFLTDPVSDVFVPQTKSEIYLFDDEDDVCPDYLLAPKTAKEIDATPSQSERGGRSHSISSSYSMEDTSSHPLDSGGSDSETDEEVKKPERGKHDSLVAPDFYSLVNKLVGSSQQVMDEASQALEPVESYRNRMRTDAVYTSGPTEATLREIEEDIFDDNLSESNSVDIWCPVPQPSQNGIQCVCLSLTSLWIVDQKRVVYWSNPVKGGRDWQAMKKHMSHISTSSSGKIVWGVYHQSAYVRSGISNHNPAGSMWTNFSRKNQIYHHVKTISCDNNKVWAILTDGKVLCRKEVSEKLPEGKIWVEVTPPISLIQIACCNDIVWGIDQSHSVYVREGVTPSNPAGTEWKSIKSPSFTSVSVAETGVVWGVGLKNSLWFRCGATPQEPGGGGPWWEVSIGTLNDGATPSEIPMWKVMSFERSASILQSFSSFLSPVSASRRLRAVSACAESGVCLLTADNQLHACWKLASGFAYDQACTHAVFNMTIWKQITASNLTQWVVRDDGDLYCIVSTNDYEHVECQSSVDVLASSPSAVWVLSKGQIWSRQGISPALPQGYSWEYIELGTHMQEFVTHLAIGEKVAWAVDKAGRVHFRFGIHPREPGTGMSPAWIEVDDQSEPPLLFRSIVVSCDDWLVWGIDEHNFAYVRRGVTANYPVGTTWEHVAGQQVKKIVASCGKVFALSPSGDLLCRQGITERNPAGNYWRRLPGNFEEIGCNPSGELWLVDSRGNVKKQRGKIVSVCSNLRRQKEKDELEQSMTVDEWEVL